jgi:Transposase zinc-binding domain/Putative transposase
VARRPGDGKGEAHLPGQEGRSLGAVEHRRDVEATALHQAVRGHLSSFLAEAEAADRGGLPRFVEGDFARYLACGVLAHGFARLACASCRCEVLVPFSCKTRGVCPSCNARRAHDTAIHLVERVLPRAPYRQWTLSLPIPVRFCLASDAQLLSEVLGLFVRALFAFQRRTARRLGVSRPLTGAVAFVQRFRSALQLTPHFHVLVPEAVFEELDGAELRLHRLPRPTDAEVETLAVTVARRTLALLRARGLLEEEAVPDGALDVLQLEGIQAPRSGPRPPARRPGPPEWPICHASISTTLRAAAPWSPAE